MALGFTLDDSSASESWGIKRKFNLLLKPDLFLFSQEISIIFVYSVLDNQRCCHNCNFVFHFIEYRLCLHYSSIDTFTPNPHLFHCFVQIDLAFSMHFELVMDGPQSFFLTEAQKRAIVALHERGSWVTHIAMRFNKSRETIHYWLKKYRENGLDGLKTLPRSGRPRETTEQQDQRIVAAGIEILFPLKM